MSDHLSFSLSDSFIKPYQKREVQWGFPIGGGNSLGELAFLTNYSRRKENGRKEQWWECCRRVVEGYYSILKDHCAANRTPWNAQKANRSAEDAYERLFTFKWSPPGRGLWMCGTEFVAKHGSAALQNCAFLSTQHLSSRNPTQPFTRLMEMSMLGIGVGFDVRGAGKLQIHEPIRDFYTFVIPDSREGWVESVNLLLRSYFTANQGTVKFDYSQIREAGKPISFGGTAAGPVPLIRLHEQLRQRFSGRAGEFVSSTDITDIENLIGKCVVAGSSRRSAEIALGFPDDKEFLNLKNWNVNPERCGEDGWSYLSNNSVITSVRQNHDHLTELIALNGEPGLLYLDVARKYGRLVDGETNADHRVLGVNPCGEQSLEDQECCTLVETFPTNCTDLADYKATLKHAYMYAKAVTLLPTHWPETNEIMQRNRRIGCSMSGVAQFGEAHGWADLQQWMDEGYAEICRRDREYSEWLGCRESIKKSSIKPSGTVSLLAGVWPGVHWSEFELYFRRMRFRADELLVPIIEAAGYHVEPDIMDPEHTVVATFPTMPPQGRSTRDVSVWEKAELAALAQAWWSDNQVSATISFREDERSQIGPVLRAFDGRLKSVSFLPISDKGAYAQMPYEAITDEQYDEAIKNVTRFELAKFYRSGEEARGERYCSNDQCEI